MTQHPGVLIVDRPLDEQKSTNIINGLNALDGREIRPSEARAPTVPGGEAGLGGKSHGLRAGLGFKIHLRAALIAGVCLLAIASSGYFGWHYWTAGRFQVSTDNAYVKADNITLPRRCRAT